MYRTICVYILLFVLKPTDSFDHSKGYNGIIQNLQNLPHFLKLIQNSPNTYSRIAECVEKSVNLRNIYNDNKILLGTTGFDISFVNVTNSTTETPIYGSTDLTDLSTPRGTTQTSTGSTNDVFSTVQTTYSPPPLFPVSEICLKHIEGVIQGLAQKQQWAIKMIDAAGKPPADILGGNLIWLGDYEECLSLSSVKATVNDTSYMFSGQYCVISVPIGGAASLFVPNPAISIGLCVPDSCSPSDTQNLVSSVLSYASNNSLTVESAICQEPDKPFDTRAIIVLVVVSLFAAVMTLGTAYDVLFIQLPKWQRVNNESEMNGDLVVEANEKAPLIKSKIIDQGEYEPGVIGKFLHSFSVYTNGAKILSTSQTTGSLTAINGIRFLSMTWVILGHSIAFVAPYSDNLMTFYPRMLKRISFGAISNALVSVDTFFTLSGILLTYLVMKELKKNEGKLNWGMFYFHRFWRLTPPYMLVLMVYVSLFPYIGSGPMWVKDGVESNYCKNSWYYNFLYINNFVDKQEDSCFGWAWYLANDMQFFVLSPLIILPLFYFHAFGVGILLAFLLGTWIATGVMATKWDIPMSIMDGNNYMKLYTRPYFRMGPYLVGMYTGYLLYRKKYRINKFLNLLGWVVASVVACLVLYGQYDDINYSRVSTEVASLYNTVHRTMWGACVSWVVFSCANGYGGFINTILSWKGLIPLSRLTYCAYLVHPVVIYHYMFTRQRLVHYTDIDVIYQFLAVVVISYGVAFVASLAFESPMMGLEKVIFRKQDKKK